MRPCNHPLRGQDRSLPSDPGHGDLYEHSRSGCPPACLECLGAGEQPYSCEVLMSGLTPKRNQSLHPCILCPAYSAGKLCVDNGRCGKSIGCAHESPCPMALPVQLNAICGCRAASARLPWSRQPWPSCHLPRLQRMLGRPSQVMLCNARAWQPLIQSPPLPMQMPSTRTALRQGNKRP